MVEARLTAASVRLRDGRALGFSAAGPADGLPIVYCTVAGLLAATSGSVAGPGIESR